MIRAVLVDDERPALRELEFLLKSFPDISVAGMYTNPLKAIEEIAQLKPQVVFLDINMPQFMGLDAASRILDLSPKTEIVFTTAFDQFAIDAFEIHALDYILKPIIPERLKKTVERLIKKQPLSMAAGNRKLRIRCLGQFKVMWEKQEPIKWRAEKTKELFAFLIQNRGRDLSKDELLDSLWPEDNPEKAVRQLYNGIYYIRKALEDYGIGRDLISIDGNYNLKLGTVDFDVERFKTFEKKSDTASIDELEELVSLYEGNYLECEYYSWADMEREALCRLHLQYMIRLSKKYIDGKLWDRSENYLLKAYNQDPYDESITELLLNIYRESGNKRKALNHYNAYLRLLADDLGINPHKRFEALVNEITEGSDR